MKIDDQHVFNHNFLRIKSITNFTKNKKNKVLEKKWISKYYFIEEIGLFYINYKSWNKSNKSQVFVNNKIL